MDCPWIQIYIYIYIYQRNAPANSSKKGSLRLAPIKNVKILMKKGVKKCYVTAQSSFEPMEMTKSMFIDEMLANMLLID